MRTGSARNWVGIAFIIVGLFWLTDNFNLFYFGLPFHHIIFSWHTLMIIIGAIIISNNNRSFFGYIVLGYGIIGTLNKLPFFPFVGVLSFHNLWPLIIILLGIWMILNMNNRKHYERRFCDEQSEKYFTKGGPANSEFWKEHVNDKTSDYFSQHNMSGGRPFHNSSSTYDLDMIDIASVFTTCNNLVTSQNFRGGKASAIFGSIKLDLTQAKLAPGENTLDISAVFGSIDIRVPAEWKVITNVSAAFGGFEDKRYLSANAQTNQESILIIKGSVVFGGGEISN